MPQWKLVIHDLSFLLTDAPTRLSGGGTQPRLVNSDALTSSIGLLSDLEIQLMERADLLDVVRMVRESDSIQGDIEWLLGLSRAQLLRIVYLLRRCLRQQLNRRAQEGGYAPLFLDAC